MTTQRLRVLVAADQELVAGSMAEALVARGLDAANLGRASERDGLDGIDIGLIVTDLDGALALHRAREVLAGGRSRWVVATSTPPGALWGAVLDAGAAVVVPTWISVSQLVSTLRDAATGQCSPVGSERDLLVAQWTRQGPGGVGEAERVRSLSGREHEVLRLLVAGETVLRVADLLAITEGTVRAHVKAMLRKLEVSSQLAAVALYRRVSGIDGWVWTDPSVALD